MWTHKNRARYDRSKLRYASDLTDDEWKLVEPLIPPGKSGGGKRTVVMREIVNGLMYRPDEACSTSSSTSIRTSMVGLPPSRSRASRSSWTGTAAIPDRFTQRHTVTKHTGH